MVVICVPSTTHAHTHTTLTGHSMGAGTAALLTTMLRESLPGCAEARCYAMACPACLTYELADSCREYVTSIINGTDIVPTFSGGGCLARLGTARRV